MSDQLLASSNVVDPLVSLAFSVYSGKGVYALLLGSGISRPAGIPTGWEIMSDLIRRVAAMSEEDCGADPAAWFSKKYKKPASYSLLLDNLTHSPAERRQLVSNYIEPSPDAGGLRTPTKAHKAIAQLVAAGYIKVIVTTNFDRLLELALAEAGITPTVIGSPDSLKGAIPLQHSSCTIIKLHGDYLDTRMKNSLDELSSYDPSFNATLDRIFDEFGLVISGWSADWDVALRKSLERCKNHRFSTFWTVRNDPSDDSKRLISHRRASVIQIKDADAFFENLQGKILSLEQMDAPHPLSAKLAVATVKRFISEDRFKIQLSDLVSNETERVYSAITAPRFSVQDFLDKDAFSRRVREYDSLTEVLRAVLLTGVNWDDNGRYDQFWLQSIKRLANVPMDGAGIVAWYKLRSYPALLVAYTLGLTALIKENYAFIGSMLSKTIVRRYEGKDRPLVLAVNVWRPADLDHVRWLPGLENRHTPLSDHLFSQLRPIFQERVPDDTEFEWLFDRLEYFWAIMHSWVASQESDTIFRRFAPIGRFCWRNRRWNSETDNTIMKIIENETKAWGAQWPLTMAGLFGHSIENFNAHKKLVDDIVAQPPSPFR